MFRLIVQATTWSRAAFDRAPSNRLVRRLRSLGRVRSALVALSLGAVYLFAAVVCSGLLSRGGPGWLNLLVLLFIWNAGKLVVTGLLISLATMRYRPRRRTNAQEWLA